MHNITFTKMTNQQINERIVIALGTNKTGNPYVVKTFETPNYAGSLDACQEFEIPLQSLPGSEGFEYVEILARVTGGDVGGGIFTVTAIARKRCEAFLRLKGQWDES